MAMRNGDAETIASLAEFPLTVQANGETYDVQTAQDFIDNFGDLVTSQTRRAVGRQQYGDLFVNSDGVMLANGAVWMSAVCEDNACNNSHWAITAINN
jgi:tRNA-dihydrouridine synthase